MKEFKNMKIEINEQQSLEDIVKVLKEFGKKYLVVAQVFEGNGFVFISELNATNQTSLEPVYEITTLAELKVV